MTDRLKLIFNYRWLNIVFILAIVFTLGGLGLAEINLTTDEPQKIDETKPVVETITTGTLTTTFPIIDNKGNNNSVVKENLAILKRKCFTSNFRPLLEENRDQLKKIQLEYRKLYYFATSIAEKIKLSYEYKDKIKNLRQEFLIKIKEIKENCQNKFAK